MNSSMTIGQYFPGNSPVHRMDARMKIVLTFLMVVAVFLCKNFWSLGLAIVFMILAVGLSKIPPISGMRIRPVSRTATSAATTRSVPTIAPHILSAPTF